MNSQDQPDFVGFPTIPSYSPSLSNAPPQVPEGIASGNFQSTMNIGGANNVTIDGTNRRIVINDGSNDIILIGYFPGGF